MNLLYDASTGEYDLGDYEITTSNDCYEIKFDSGFSLIVDKETTFSVKTFNGSIVTSTVEQLAAFMVSTYSVPNCCVLQEFDGKSVDERINELEYYMSVCGRINNYMTEQDIEMADVSFDHIERLVNSLGCGTIHKTATAKNRSGRFIKGKLIDSIYWSDECERKIVAITKTNSDGYKINRLSGEPKLVVCTGISMVPFYI